MRRFPFLYFSLSLFSGFPDFVKMYTGGGLGTGTGGVPLPG